VPITPAQVQAAQLVQHTAAHDPATQVRLIAGPGTGKSFAIQERVASLLRSQIHPSDIFVVSFTRASARDLQERIRSYCTNLGLQGVSQVSVSTLHSLALRSLRLAGLLVYPADPLVLDDWELEHLHDAEYSASTGFRPGRAGSGATPTRAEDIRLDYEAFCGTGVWQPPGYILPSQPITPSERQGYTLYHQSRTQLYSYVLPGEIVRQCVENIQAGVLDLRELLHILHLIVDEYQDLNPSDIAFVDALIHSGVTTFVAGDDDQSLYSFRYASPVGLQLFDRRHPATSQHQLSHSFRSTPNVLAPALDLIAAFADPTRLPKQLSSLYTNAQPPEPGVVHRWRFTSGTAEARAIAESCRDLIGAGMHPREIMILLSNTRATLSTLRRALQAAGVSYQSPRAESFVDTSQGRFAFALLRIGCDTDDYVAHRVLFGAYPGVGPTTCHGVAQAALSHALNYRRLFYDPVPQLCAAVSQWAAADTLAARIPVLDHIVRHVFGDPAADKLAVELAPLPLDASLQEARDFLWADNDEQRGTILHAVYDRLGLTQPSGGFLPPQVRIMTMHGAKGLGATVTFVPALEEEILPGPRRQPYPGLVLEAARMLYVSITRARAACILSFARTRFVYGAVANHTRSRFVPHLAGPFLPRTSGLDAADVSEIILSAANL
jgi:DNA helicase-2/ATP-dependent DNA helicase PcrA